MRKKLKNYLYLFTVGAIIVLLDQWTKSFIRTYLPYGDFWSPWEWLTPYARFVHWYNTGVAFGLFQNNNVLFSVLVSIIIIFIIIYYPQLSEDDWFLKTAMGFQLGGAIGNLIDRLTIGHVTDFISVGNFAVFNIADASVTVGVGIMILGLWIEERKLKREKLSEGQELVGD